MLTRILPHLALLMAMFVWATSFIALKIGLSAYSPTTLMAFRMTVAAAMFLPFARSLWRAFRCGGHWKLLGFMLLCEPCFYFLFETYALRYTSASQAGMVVAVLPVTVTIAARIALGERAAPRAAIGCVLAVGGVIWLSLDAVRTESAPNPMLGNFLEVLAMLCATVYTVSLKRLSTVYTPVQMTAVQSAAGMVFFVLLMLLAPPEPAVPASAEFPAWLPPAAVIYLGICVTLGGYGFYNYGVSRVRAGQASAYLNLIPVMTLALGVLFLREAFAPEQYLASGLVIAGVLLSQQRS